MTKLEKKIGSK